MDRLNGMPACVLGILLMIAAGPSWAVFTRGGGLGVGARAMGMGGAFVSVADDASAASWNPAGLIQLQKTEMMGMVGSLFNDKSRNTYLTVHYPTAEDIHLSLSTSNLFFSEMKGSHEDDYQASVAVPLSPNRRLSGGLNVHYLFARLDAEGGIARGMGADLGFLFNHPLQNGKELRFGLRVSDLSTTVRFRANGEEQRIPTMFTPGLAFRFDPDTLIALDVNWTDDNSIPREERLHLRGGLEHWFFGRHAGFRAGYVSYTSMPGMVCLGASYRGRSCSLDYAFAGHPEHLGNSHRVAAGWRFGTGEVRPPSQPTLLESMVGDERIHLSWTPPAGVQVEGYRIYLKEEGEPAFRRVQPSLLASNYCLLRGAQNGILYHIYITAVVGGRESPPTNEVTATPRLMSEGARHYYDLGIQSFNSNKLSESLYSARKAEELDPNYYEIKELIRKIEETMKKGFVQPEVKP